MRKITLVSGNEINEEKLEWLWYPYIPKNKVCVLAGFQGEGKSTMAVDIMAAVTNGRALPEYSLNVVGASDKPIPTVNVSGNILLINSEDGLKDTIIPRLRRAEADLSKCKLLPPDIFLGNQTMNESLEVLRKAIQDYSIKLVVIDPLNSNLPSDVSSRGGDKLNKFMTGLSKIADSEDCAFILITHVAKSARNKEELDMTDVLGAVGIMGTARIGLIVEEQTWGCTKRKILRHVKSNITSQDTAINFSIGENGQFLWGVFFDRNKNKPPSDKEAAKIYITNALSKTKLSWKNLEALRREFYVTDSTWKRARKELGIVADNINKTWELPKYN